MPNVAIAMLVAGSVLAADLDVNLAVNPGFEHVNVNDTGPFTAVRLLGWQDASGDADDTWSYPYSSNYSGANEPPGANSYHFAGGFNTSSGQAQVVQVIDVSDGATADLIASGQGACRLSAYFSSYLTQADASYVEAVFLDSGGVSLGSVEVGGYPFVQSLDVIGGQRAWGLDSAHVWVPAGTVSVRLVVGSAIATVNHDGYVDLVDFQITADEPPPGPEDTPPSDLRVGTLNIQNRQGADLTQIISIMQTVDADVWGLQETDSGQGPIIAAALGYVWQPGFGSGPSFVSRYPVVATTAHQFGARIELSIDQHIWVFNTHVGLFPNWERSYVPYAAANGLNERQIVDNVLGLDNWTSQMSLLDEDMQVAMASGLPIFLTGDFNEPSHLDWTQTQADAGIIPLAVDAPLSHVLTDGLHVDYFADLVDQNGVVTDPGIHILADFDGWNLRDGYAVDRQQDGENEVTRRGFTWTPGGCCRDDDRIDFVYVGGEGVEVADARLFGEAGGLDVDIGFVSYPTDHRGVVVDVDLPPTPPACECAGLDALGLDVMSFNVLISDSGGYTHQQKVEQIAQVIRRSGAELVGIQEGANHAVQVHAALGGDDAGWYISDPLSTADGGDSGKFILSRFPIIARSELGLGVRVRVAENRTAWIFNIHAPFSGGYGPYLVRDNPGIPEADVLAATWSQIAAAETVVSDAESSAAPGEAAFIVGDFNDPSHFDWTQDAANVGLHFGRRIAWEASQRLEDAGFVDSYRASFPDEIADLGETWSPMFPTDVQDRIDFVYGRGDAICLCDAINVGEADAPARANVDLVVEPFPSDHRAVLGRFAIGLNDCAPDLNSDGLLNFFDVQAFLAYFAAMDAQADFVADGQFDFFDVQAFLSAFSVGCS